MIGRLNIVDEGVLNRNPLPGHQAISAYHPMVLPLSRNELLCCFRQSQALYSLDGRLMFSRSRDGGSSWVLEGPLGPAIGDGFCYSAGWLSRARDGTLLLVGLRHPATQDQLIRFSAETGGWMGDELFFCRSGDDGRTWDDIELPRLDTGSLPGHIDIHSPIIELDDGRWMLSGEMWKSWDDPEPLHIKGVKYFSDDYGKSWRGPLELPTNRDDNRMYSHAQYRRLTDGQVAALMWTQSVGGAESFDLHLITGSTDGADWTVPQPTGIDGQTSCLADLADGMWVAAYSRRERDRPGIAVVLSQDSGTTWNIRDQILVWDAVGQEFLGTQHRPDYPASHDNIAFGKPDVAVLSEREVLVSWWCTQKCVTQIRFAKLEVHTT